MTDGQLGTSLDASLRNKLGKAIEEGLSDVTKAKQPKFIKASLQGLKDLGYKPQIHEDLYERNWMEEDA